MTLDERAEALASAIAWAIEDAIDEFDMRDTAIVSEKRKIHIAERIKDLWG